MNLEPASELAFPREEYENRLKRLRVELRGAQLEGLLVHSPRLQCYLTGFETVNTWAYRCLVIPLEGEPVLSVIQLEESAVQLTSWIRQLALYRPGESPIAATVEMVKTLGLESSRIGIEMETLSLSPLQYAELAAALARVSFVDSSSLLRSLTICKSEAEIALIRRAAGMTDQGMAAAVAAAARALTDQEIAAAGYDAMMRAGSEYMSLQPIVTTGTRSGVPHTTHKRTSLKRGDPIFLEFGACVNRYSSPMMRTVVVGPPSDEIRRTADATLAALNYAIEAIRPGVTANEVASAAWKGIDQDRKSVFFHSVVGYSIGLSFPPTWGDAPMRLLRGVQTRLETGMVFHLPMASRDLGRYTVGSSETVVVTKTGCEVMGRYPREVVVL